MITPEQVRFFLDNGYLVIRGLIPQRDIEALRSAVDVLQRDALDKLRRPGYAKECRFLSREWIEHPADHYVYREKPGGEISFHRIERMFERQPLFREFATSPRLLNVVWRVLERPFWPRGGSLVVKLPHEGAEVRWHQDIPYLYWSSGGHSSRGRPATHPIPNFNTDIYLDPSDESNGCLYAIPGSHRNGTVDVDKLVAEHGWMLPGCVPLEVEPGDVVLHHVALVHGSPENHSPALRRTFYIHYMADETLVDAYSDWPNILTAEEAQRLWGAALAGRAAWLASRGETASDEGAGPHAAFEPTPAGLRPRNGR